MLHNRSQFDRPFGGGHGGAGDHGGNGNGGNDEDDRDDNGGDKPEDGDMIPLHGVVLPPSNEQPAQPLAPPIDEAMNTLTLRAFDDGVPARDFQPRLLRFGEAA